MPLTNAQVRAEIDRLNQAMADRSKFTSKRGDIAREWLFQIENACRINGIHVESASVRLPGITRSAMEKPASGWFLHWSLTTRTEEHMSGYFREHVFQHFKSSTYQAALHEKLLKLKPTADIKTYNGRAHLPLRKQLKAPDSDTEDREEQQWTNEDLAQIISKKDLFSFFLDDHVMKILSPTLIGELQGITPGAFNASTQPETFKLTPTRNPEYQTVSSQYASATSEAESDSSADLQRMTLGPSGEEMLRDRQNNSKPDRS
ncbi:hypothetical protein PHMEG_00017691 [Phytophthora megakarya]|uniref:Uncharacterized protein n=1 Tax=Phytophthora megakarya TaxID=4795 RepID=A0A225VWQ0_9STRA|nr:hypothetical protein PHMEG_00017691 [Phytophthora megakarya]